MTIDIIYKFIMLFLYNILDVFGYCMLFIKITCKCMMTDAIKMEIDEPKSPTQAVVTASDVPELPPKPKPGERIITD